MTDRLSSKQHPTVQLDVILIVAALETLHKEVLFQNLRVDFQRREEYTDGVTTAAIHEAQAQAQGRLRVDKPGVDSVWQTMF